MSEWLSQQNAASLMPLVAVTLGLLVAITAIVCAAWTKVRRAEAQVHIAETEAALKQQMIEKGMSADEIERVLAAGKGKKSKQDALTEAPPAA